MGKKRERSKGSDHIQNDSSLLPSSYSDAMPCSSGFALSKKKKSSRLADSKESKPGTSSMDVTECSVKQLNAHLSSHPRHNSSQSIFLKRSRHGHQYPWRNSVTNFRASTSQGRPSNWDERLSFKLANHYRTEEHGHYAEIREGMLSRPERIRSNMDGGLPDVMKIPCGICHNLFRKRPSGEYAVVAVLVCGHLYHANCLEHKTPQEDKSDPPCPICSGVPVEIEDGSRVGCFC